MNIITQPANSSICGQCCTAMVLDHLYPHLGFTEQTVIEAIGHKHGTHFRDLEKIFDMFYVVAEAGKPIYPHTVLPELCLLSLYYPKNGGRQLGGHWILVYRGVVYDPGELEPIEGELYQRLRNPSLTTYHEIKGYKTDGD
jgi:hypothetical protein